MGGAVYSRAHMPIYNQVQSALWTMKTGLAGHHIIHKLTPVGRNGEGQ